MKRQPSLFFRYVMTYMAVCVVTISVFATFLYATNVRDTQRVLRDEYQALVARGGDMLGDRLGGLYELSVVLQARDALDEISRISSPINPRHVPAILAFTRELQPYSYANLFIRELILFFTRGDLFISSSTIGLYPNVYYDVTLRYPDIAYAKWREEIAAPQYMSHYGYTDARTGEAYLDILQDFSTSWDGNKVVMIARINESDLLTSLEGAIAQGGIALLHDRDGALAYASDTDIGDSVYAEDGRTILHGGMRYVPFVHTLDTVGWTYTLLVPESIFQIAQRQFFKTLALLVLAVLLTGIIMSVLLSLWGVMPIRRLLRVFRPAGGGAAAGGNEYAHLDAHIRDMLQNNEHLRAEVGRYMEVSRASFLDRLLGSGFASREALLAIAQHHGLVMEYRCFILAVFELAGYNSDMPADFLQEMDMATIVITDFLDKRVEMGAFVHKVDFSHIALIFCLDEQGLYETVLWHVSQLCRAVPEKLRLELRCAISGEIDDVGALNTAYYALCRELVKSDTPPGEPLRLPGGRIAAGERYHYPIDLEVKLLNYLTAGNEAEALGLMESVYHENTGRDGLTATGALLLFSAVRGTLMRAREQIELPDAEADARLDALLNARQGGYPHEQWKRNVEAAALLCDAVRQRKDLRNLDLVERIDRYVNTHYQDSQLDLGMVARQFSLTGNYLSYFYKQVTGENISTIIEKTRMQQAEALLREGGRQIKDIASMVGYTNLNTFYKAFKRVYGISPKGYYDQLRYQNK